MVADHRLPLVAVNVWYHVGAANETPGRTGFAHLFEHMMFAGSKHIPNGMADSLLEAAGGDTSNGSTSFDRTNYFETVPSNQLELSLWIHADRMGYMLDVLDAKALAVQQAVVRNERRQTHENKPYGLVEDALWNNLFPPLHPYHAAIIGSHADIQSATFGDIKNFFKTYYRPNNATLVIAGDIDKPKTKHWIEKYFGSLKPGDSIPTLNVEQPVLKPSSPIQVEDTVALPRVIIGWHTPKVFSPGDAELLLAGQILGGGRSSRLHRKLVYEKQIAQEVTAYQYSLQLGSVFVIDALAKPGHSAEELEKAIDEELTNMQSSVTSSEIERGLNIFETASVSGFEKLGNLADMLNLYNHYTANPTYFVEEIKAFRNVSATQIQSTVKQYLLNKPRITIYGIPGKKNLAPEIPTPQLDNETSLNLGEKESLNKEEEWRNSVPKAGPSHVLNLPEPRKFTLKNGLTVLYHYTPKLPLVSASLVFRSGSFIDPPNKRGLAALTAELLDEGTTSRSSIEIANQLAQLGANLSISTSHDVTMIDLFALKRNFNQASQMMSDIVMHPSFTDEEIDRQRTRKVGELVQIKESPGTIANIAASRSLYGPSHPYAYPIIGTEQSLKQINREDIINFWKKNYIPTNAALIISGDISGREILALADSLFKDWKRDAENTGSISEKNKSVISHLDRIKKTKLILINKPDAQQTAIRIVAPGPKRITPDFEELEVFNAAFGGLFTSRLNMNLRERKGFTYGINSDFKYGIDSGPFTIGTNVRTDATAASIKEIFSEITKLKNMPISGSEFQKALNSQLLSLPGDFETNTSIAHSFSDLFIYGLSIDYFSREPLELKKVTTKQVNNTAKKYIRPEKMIVVCVGDSDKIKQTLIPLDFDMVEYKSVEEYLSKNLD